MILVNCSTPRLDRPAVRRAIDHYCAGEREDSFDPSEIPSELGLPGFRIGGHDEELFVDVFGTEEDCFGLPVGENVIC